MHGSGCQGRKSHYERCDGKNDKSAQKTCNNSKLQCFGSITPGTFQIALPHNIAKKNTSCTGNTETENRADITDYYNQRIGSNRIRTKVPQDHRVHGKTNTPGNIITKSRQGKPHEITEQKFVFYEHTSKIQSDIFAESRNNKTGEQLDHSGKCSSDSHTGSTKLGCSEQSEDKSRIQKDIQSKGQHIHRHAGSYPANASKNSQINLRHTPADIGDTHNADIGRTDGQKLRIIGE